MKKTSIFFSLTWKSSKSEKDEKKIRKRPFTLDVNKYHETERLSPSSDKHKAVPKYSRKSDSNRLSPMREHKSNDKPKRGKTRTRSPMQNHRKGQTLKKNSPLSKSPAASDGYHKEAWDKATAEDAKVTSDESSCGIYTDKAISSQTSPRKNKKMRDNTRRKSTPRSPTGSRTRRRSGSVDGKSSSLPGSLPRRRSSTQAKTLDQDCPKYGTSSRLSPCR